MSGRANPKFRSQVALWRRLKILTTALGACLIGGGSLWLLIGDLTAGYVSLPTGRHSSMAIRLADMSPALIPAFLFWAVMILFFGGIGLLLLRDAFRSDPRTG